MEHTINVSQRIPLLKKLKKIVKEHEQDIIDALYKDFKKPPMECYLTEINVVYSELNLFIKKTKGWAKPKQVLPSVFNMPSSEYIYHQPYGKVLIISPWNYPFQLAICPLIAAIAAGNTVVLKPSEISSNTSEILNIILNKVFEPKHVTVIHGGAEVSAKLLEQNWDYVFFTGSIQVGKIVAQAASKHLTPYTLELGGKSPCIVSEEAHLAMAAKKIVWGKFLNAGQTCIAPDYVVIHATEKFNFVKAVEEEIKKSFGENIIESTDFARIINNNHFERLKKLIHPDRVLLGGQVDGLQRYIEPTLVEVSDLEDPIMQEEIFGPILPILTFTTANDIKKIVNHFSKPLAFYVFTENKKEAEKLINQFSFGGGCVNDCIMHYANHRLPFGGVGSSGMGNYHGKHGFLTFSHQKSIVKRASWLEAPVRYPPYEKKYPIIKKLLSMLN